METIILSSDSHGDLDLIMKLADKLGISIKKLSKNDVEEIGLSLAIKKGRTGEFVDNDSFLNELDQASKD